MPIFRYNGDIPIEVPEKPRITTVNLVLDNNENLAYDSESLLFTFKLPQRVVLKSNLKGKRSVLTEADYRQGYQNEKKDWDTYLVKSKIGPEQSVDIELDLQARRNADIGGYIEAELWEEPIPTGNKIGELDLRVDNF